MNAEFFDAARLLDADYLHCVAAAGWCVNTGLAFFFLIPRQGATSTVADRGFWLTVAAAFVAVGAVCVAGVLGTYATLLRWPFVPDRVAHFCAAAATLLTLAALPRPAGIRRRAVWRWGFGIMAAAACVVVAASPSIALGWWLAAAAGAAAAYIAFWIRFGRRAADAADGRVLVFAALGTMLLALAIVFGVGHTLEFFAGTEGARAASGMVRWWQGALLATVALIVMGLLWWEYLDECTLPRIRARRGIFGVRPIFVLPMLQAFVLCIGGVLFLGSSRQAENYVDRRILTEISTLVASLDWSAAATSGGSSAGESRAWRLRQRLERIVGASDSYSAAVAWYEEGERVQVLAAVSGGTPGMPFDAHRLLPLPAELPAARAGGSVRWIGNETLFERATVTVPVPAEEVGARAWYLSLSLDARELANLIATHRLQALMIVTLAVILVASAVVYTVRTLNEAELRLLKESAEAENNARNAFLGMISHEIRTPLQSVLGYAELAESTGLHQDTARHVRAIRTQGAILLRIVQDILDFSAVRGGGLTLNPEAVSLHELIDDVQRGLASRAHAKGIVFSTEISGAVPPWVTVDPIRLAQVLLNLTVNAVKFTDRGGVRLVVSCEGVEEGRAALTILISDTGPGISPAQMRRLFEPFRKMRDDDTLGGGGVGLGLAISRQIVDRLGGRITAESVDGEGTTFEVNLNLPVASGPAGGFARTGELAAPAGRPVVISSLAGLHVLLIDDNPYVRELLRDFLRKLGARVCVRPDGTSGLQACAHDRFDVVLLDLRLPDFQGPELAGRLRAIGRSPSDPWIVGISAGVSDAEIQRTLEMGVNDFMLKPVSMAGLAETIRMSPAGEKIVATEVQPAPAGELSADQRAAFFAELEPMFDRLEQSCLEAQGARLGAEAHYLANGCMVTGFEEGLHLCREIEQLAEGGSFPLARERIASLRRLFASVIPAGSFEGRT